MSAERERLKVILRELGLTEKEAEVYIAIAAKGSATAKELLNTLEKIHQPQLYNIISSLIRKGFVRASMGRPKLYIANDLGAIFEAKRRLLDNLREEALVLLSRIQALEKETSGGPHVFLVRGREGLETVAIEVFSNARVEVCAELPTSMAISIADVIERILSRGVNAYIIVFPEVPDWLTDRLSKYDNITLKRDKLGSFLFVSADARLAVYARRRFFSPRKIPVPESEVYGFYISERDLIWRLINIFENTWRRVAEPVIQKPVHEKKYPKVFMEFGLALDELEDLLRSGYRPYVRVEGLYVRTSEPVVVEGEVVKVTRTDHVNNFSVKVGNDVLTVGGFDAEVEDVESEKITIVRVEKVE